MTLIHIMDDNTIEMEMYLEVERKKCLKNIQQFYKKYGCEKIDTLRTYLLTLCDSLTDEKEIDEIKRQINILDNYA